MSGLYLHVKESARRRLDSAKLFRQHGQLGVREGVARPKDLTAVNARLDALVYDGLMSGRAHSGDLQFKVTGPTEISLSRLNSAPDGELVVGFDVELVSSDGQVHSWSTLPALVTVAKNGSPAVANPELDAASYAFDAGKLHCAVTIHTDEGSTPYQAGVAAAGDITCVAGANLVDGETVTLETTEGKTYSLEFDDNGSTAIGNIPVPFTAGDTDVEVADAVRAALAAANVGITASGATATVVLTQDVPGTDGETTIAETVANVGFTKTDFTGATDPSTVTLSVAGESNKWHSGDLASVDHVIKAVP